MALQFYLPAVGVPNIRRMCLRALPDARVVEGEWFPTSTFRTALGGFINNLSLFRFRANNLELDEIPIASISPTGLFVLQQPFTFAVNNYVNILGVKTATGASVSGRFVITARTDSQNGTLGQWVAGAGLGGRIRQDQIIYPAYVGSSDIEGFKVVVRKVGRPFGQYVGRQSKRA